MTFSIVARDPETGALGVAVQTCMFAVGAIVPWVRPGVGAVATQAISEPAYGPRCLDAMASGASAGDALAGARAADPGSGLRQVGVVDAHGGADAFTGELCIDHAGHHVGAGYAVQANMMASADVWPAMAAAFEAAEGALDARLLAALVAGERAGGDARGRMSAALVVVDDNGPIVDLRVDDHPDPISELTRLLDASRAFRAYFRATDALFGGQPDVARSEVEHALALRPGDENMRFLRAGALLFSGRPDEAQAELQSLIAQRPSWRTVVESFAAKGLLVVPDSVDVETFLGR